MIVHSGCISKNPKRLVFFRLVQFTYSAETDKSTSKGATVTTNLFGFCVERKDVWAEMSLIRKFSFQSGGGLLVYFLKLAN